MSEVTEFSKNLIDAVEKAIGFKLDSMPETLPILDYYCNLYRNSRNAIRDKSSRDISQDIGQLLAPMAGSYFGEVVRSKFDTFWYAPLHKYELWRIQFKYCFLYFNPVAIAEEILNREEPSCGDSSFFTKKEDAESLKRIIKEWNDVSEDDYFTFSARWEMLDFIQERLTTSAILGKKESGNKQKIKTYTTRDYENYILAMEEKK